MDCSSAFHIFCVKLSEPQQNIWYVLPSCYLLQLDCCFLIQHQSFCDGFQLSKMSLQEMYLEKKILKHFKTEILQTRSTREIKRTNYWDSFLKISNRAAYKYQNSKREKPGIQS